MKKRDFIEQFLPLAQEAGKQFNMNPVIILAQSAIETGWDESTLCKEHNNYFGITAYGRPNLFWNGKRTDLSNNPNGRATLWFRCYETAQQSFLDFARLICAAYPTAAKLTYQPLAYAKAIAYSKYISEVNGDNRPAYQHLLVTLSRSIEKLITPSS